MQLRSEFLAFLLDNPEVLRNFLNVAQEWYKIQGELPDLDGTPLGGKKWKAGDEVNLTTVKLSDSVIDQLIEKLAEGSVKEKAVAYVKGFLASIAKA